MAHRQQRKTTKFGAASEGLGLPKGWLDYTEFTRGIYARLLGNPPHVTCHPMDEKKA